MKGADIGPPARFSVVHPLAAAIVIVSLGVGGLYFAATAPPAQPGLYIVTRHWESHLVPQLDARALPSTTNPSEWLPLVVLLPTAVSNPDQPQPHAFYLVDPQHMDPPIDPKSLTLTFFAFNTRDGRTDVSDPVPMPSILLRLSDALYRIDSPVISDYLVVFSNQPPSARFVIPPTPDAPAPNARAVILVRASSLRGGAPQAFALLRDPPW